MTRFWKILPAFSAAVFAALCASAEPWHSPLYLDGGRPHAKRVEIAFENRGGETLDGKISLVSAKDLGIAGRPAKELRVVGENGRELLFAVVPDSETLSENSELAIPVACAPNGKTRAWVYFDNPAAWELPSNLGASAVSAAADAEEKIDFESGGKFPPQNWSDNSQKTYRNELAAAGGRGGGKCASTVAEKGSKPQWVCISREFPAEAGDKFKFSGWVRGENVKGKAGFYIHVGPKNIHKDQNSGTFDWKKIEFEGVVPEGVKSVSFGTVLYASEGRAFFDDLYVKNRKIPQVAAGGGGRKDGIPRIVRFRRGRKMAFAGGKIPVENQNRRPKFLGLPEEKRPRRHSDKQDNERQLRQGGFRRGLGRKRNAVLPRLGVCHRLRRGNRAALGKDGLHLPRQGQEKPETGSPRKARQRHFKRLRRRTLRLRRRQNLRANNGFAGKPAQKPEL